MTHWWCSSRVQATWPWRSLSILCSIISWFPPSMPKAILSLSIHSCPEKPTPVPSPSHSRPFPTHLSHFWIRHLLLVPFIWETSMYSFVALFQLNGYVFLVYQLVFMGFISAIRQQLLEGNTLILYLQNKSWALHVANAQPVGLLPRLLSAYPVKIRSQDKFLVCIQTRKLVGSFKCLILIISFPNYTQLYFSFIELNISSN